MRASRLLGSLVVASSLVMAAPSVRAESPPFETIWSVRLEGCQVVPAVTSTASGSALLRIPNFGGDMLTYNVTYSGLSGTVGEIHLHGPAARGTTGAVVATLPVTGTGEAGGTLTLTSEQRIWLEGGLLYVDVHASGFPDGELRAQIDNRGSACPPPADAGVIDATAPDGGTGAGADAAGTDTDRGGGCAAGGDGAGAGVIALALGALVGAARRRRRA